ncbi:MAG: hypothetical protein V2A71_02040, partial [Candidatus Eisenbacteria bacterium]
GRRGGSAALWALSGALFGATFLTRPIALPLSCLTFLPAWLELGTRRALGRWAVLFAAFSVVVAPWFLRNWITMGDPTPLSTDGGYNLWFASTPNSAPKWFDSQEFRWAVREDGYHIDRTADRRFRELAASHVKTDPAGFLARGVERVAWTWSYLPGSQSYRSNPPIFWLLRGAHLALLLFAILGLFTIGRSQALYFLFPAIGLSCVLVFTRGMSRFVLPAMPLVLLLAGQGFRYGWRRLPGRGARPGQAAL